MSEPNQQNQDKLIETLFIPLCIHALESQRPDALLKDETAVKVVARYV